MANGTTLTDIDRELNPGEVQNYVNQGYREWLPRWDLVRRWRDLRYMRDNVRALIPDAMRSTDFEYHDGTFNKACFELASFLSAAAPVFTVSPPSNTSKEPSSDIEDVLTGIFGPGGVLDVESNGQVPFTVWENQGENGHGIYKLVLKRSYPLSMPQRVFADAQSDASVSWEDNPAYQPHSRKDERAVKGETKYRESDASLKQRRAKFEEDEFAFQWMSVDPRTIFEFRQGDQIIMKGEVYQRPATMLNEHGLAELNNNSSGYVMLGPASPKDSGTQTSGQVRMTNCFELWTRSYGYFGFISGKLAADGTRPAVLSKNSDYCWVNALNRVPYFDALGFPSTEEDTAGKYHGAFDSLIAETPLLNYLETLHFNAGHRQQLPMYQPVRDGGYSGEAVPLNSEFQQMVTEDQIEEVDLPVGWKWEPVNPGTEVSIFQQLQACRERITNNALAAVLTGTSSGPDSSGAAISLKLNAATRSMSPLVRHHETPMAEMAHTLLDTAKRLQITLEVEKVTTGPDGTNTVKKLSLKPEDIVTTRVQCSYNIELPIDQAAKESRGMMLVQGGHMSPETAGPRFFSITDPEKEKIRITLAKFRGPTEEIAWRLAMQELAAQAPEIFKDIIGLINPPGPPATGSGGGPTGPYGGATAELARGAPAAPNAGQTSGMPQPPVVQPSSMR